MVSSKWPVGDSVPLLHRTTRPSLVMLIAVAEMISLSQGSRTAAEELSAAPLRIVRVSDEKQEEIPCSNATAFGFYVFANDRNVQLAVIPSRGTILGVLAAQETVIMDLECLGPLCGDIEVKNTGTVAFCIELDGTPKSAVALLNPGEKERRNFSFCGTLSTAHRFTVIVRNLSPHERCSWEARILSGARRAQCPLVSVSPGDPQKTPPRRLPELHPEIEAAMIEWDWRQQDDLAAVGNSSDKYLAVLQRAIDRGNSLVQNYLQRGVAGEPWTQLVGQWKKLAAQWQTVKEQFEQLGQNASLKKGFDEQVDLDEFWRRTRWLKRQIAFFDPGLQNKKIVFIKSAPSIFSHQLTQYTGNCARPGGGVFILDRPGQSMAFRELVSSQLPQGSFQFCDVSPDGSRVLFSYCPVERAPRDREEALDRFFHLYEVNLGDGTVRQLTDGPYDDFAGKYLPDGRLVFVSTRRGGFHRCGRGPCPVHTLTVAEGNGRNIRVVSFHETHEWDPVPLWDGNILYTRWDYVDRNAVFY